MAFPEDPTRSASEARIFWQAKHDPRVVEVDALTMRHDDRDALDHSRLGIETYFLAHPFEGQKVLFKDGLRMLRFDVRSGTLSNGPVRLRYALEGIRDLGHKLLTLRRLVGLRRLGRLPLGLFPAERRAPRWILIIRTLDAVAAGASHRDIAAVLFGSARVRADWRAHSDYLRLRVQRLKREGSQLVDGGYLTLLRDRPPCERE